MLFKFSFLPKENRFFDIFEMSAKNLLDAATAFHDLLHDFTNVSKKVEKITEYEEKGDALTHEVIQVLNRTFVTPIDREDIFRLAESLDDVLDQIEDAASRLILFEIPTPTPFSIQLSNYIMQCCRQIHVSMPNLRNLKDHPALQDSLLQIHSLENSADAVKKQAIYELFQHPEDVITLLKWREIYEHMEAATDRCEDVADVLQGLLVKNA